MIRPSQVRPIRPRRRPKAAPQVRSTVEAILRYRGRGEAAVREYSESSTSGPRHPQTFRGENRRVSARLAVRGDPTTLSSHRPQIRNFALTQPPRCRTWRCKHSGVVLGHKTFPSTALDVTCRAGGSNGGLRAHERCHGEGGRRQRIIASAPPFGGKPHPAIVAAMHSVAPMKSMRSEACKRSRAWLGHGKHRRPSTCSLGPGNAFVAEAKRQFRTVASTLLRSYGDAHHRGTTHATLKMAAVDLIGQAEHGRAAPPFCSRTRRSSAGRRLLRWKASVVGSQPP